MKKTVLQSTVILVIVSVIAKALSFIVRIMLARTLSPSAMNYYTLAAPTMVFFITLAQMGIPGALSKVIAQSDHPHQPLKVSVILSLLNNAVIILTFLLVLPFLATRILKQKEILPVLYAIIPLIPLVSLSGILKGYLFGLQHHVQATSSQLFEEGSRILFLFVVFYLHPLPTQSPWPVSQCCLSALERRAAHCLCSSPCADKKEPFPGFRVCSAI